MAGRNGGGVYFTPTARSLDLRWSRSAGSGQVPHLIPVRRAPSSRSRYGRRVCRCAPKIAGRINHGEDRQRDARMHAADGRQRRTPSKLLLPLDCFAGAPDACDPISSVLDFIRYWLELPAISTSSGSLPFPCRCTPPSLDSNPKGIRKWQFAPARNLAITGPTNMRMKAAGEHRPALESIRFR